MSTATSPDTQDPSIDGATEQRQQTPRDDGQTPLARAKVARALAFFNTSDELAPSMSRL
jgi:hypothetical protein